MKPEPEKHPPGIYIVRDSNGELDLMEYYGRGLGWFCMGNEQILPSPKQILPSGPLDLEAIASGVGLQVAEKGLSVAKEAMELAIARRGIIEDLLAACEECIDGGGCDCELLTGDEYGAGKRCWFCTANAAIAHAKEQVK